MDQVLVVMSAAKRVLVVGGSGYLGRHIVRAGLKQGLAVASFSRSGAPHPSVMTDDLQGTEWLSGSAESADGKAELTKALDGASAVVSCLGTPFGTRESILRINGHANVAITQAAKEAGIGRYVYVSASTFRLMESMFPDSWGAYFEGKRLAEAAVTEHFGDAGAVLKASARRPINQANQNSPLSRACGCLPVCSPASSTQRTSKRRVCRRASGSRRRRCQTRSACLSASSLAHRRCSGPRSRLVQSVTSSRHRAA